MEYSLIEEKDYAKYRPEFQWRVVPTWEDQQQLFARELAARIQENQKRGNLTKIAVPTGPVDLKIFSDYCNEHSVSCESLVVFLVDEFCDENGKAVPVENPFSLQRYFKQNLYENLRPELRMPADQIIYPDPDHIENVNNAIAQYGGLDVTYSGLGINGHIAMNEPVYEGAQVTVDEMLNWTTRVVVLSRESVTQLAMAMTAGNLEHIPPKMITLGLKELFSAKELHLYFLRTWHAAGFRRALFGPVTPRYPGSLYQKHPSVTVTLTKLVTEMPLVNVKENIGA